MGVIRKQSIQGTIFLYMGVVLGFLTQALILPNYFTLEQNGLVKILGSYALIFAQFGSLGLLPLAVRSYPWFKENPTQRNRFYTTLVAISLIGATLATFVFLGLEQVLARRNPNNNLASQYLPYTVVLIYTIVIFNILDAFMRSLLKSTQGIFLKEFLQRLVILLGAIGVIGEVFNFHQFVIFFLIAFAVPTLIIGLQLHQQGEVTLQRGILKVNPAQRKEMISVAGISLLAGFSGLGLSHVDSIMLEEMAGLEITGAYAVAGYFAVLIAIPSRNVFRITMTVIAQAFASQDLKAIQIIYQKSSLNLMIVGGLLLLGLYANADNVFAMLPAEYETARPALLTLAFSNFLIMVGGASAQVIANSKLYRYNGYFGLGLIVMAIITNWLFIPIWGAVGAAMASLVSMFVYKFAKYWILYQRYRFQPFTLNSLWVVLIGCATAVIVYFLPLANSLVVNIVWVSSITTVLFLVPIFFLNLSPDLNEIVIKIWYKIRKKPQ